MPEVWIVVPVYNVRDYLACCLDSLLAQSFTDIRVVCVDDGSTDGSSQVLAEYAERDSRICTLRKPNGGLSSARNAGIEAVLEATCCRGDRPRPPAQSARSGDAPKPDSGIVMFVDADDWLAPEACRIVRDACAEHGADIVTFGGLAEPPEASYPWLEEVLSPRDAVYHAFEPAVLFAEKSRPFVWRTALSVGFLRKSGLRFDETLPFGEDQVFQFMAYPQAGTVVFLHDRLYHYRVSRTGSLMDTNLDGMEQRLAKHTAIVAGIQAGWRRLGLLTKYGAEYLEWVLEFMLWDIQSQSVAVQERVLAALGALLAEDFAAADLDRLALKPSSRGVFKAVLAASAQNRPCHITRLQMQRYRLDHWGWRSLLGR